MRKPALEWSIVKSKERRQRRVLSPEFRTEAVRLWRIGDRTIGQVAKDLDLTKNSLREWVKRAYVDAGKGAPDALTTSEREELARHTRVASREVALSVRLHRQLLNASFLRALQRLGLCLFILVRVRIRCGF